VTATREKLLDLADCYAAMGYGNCASDARKAASKLDIKVAVSFDNGTWASLSVSDLAPAAAPDDEGLSEEDCEADDTVLDEQSARCLEYMVECATIDTEALKVVAREIRTALANGAGEVRAAKSAVDAALIERLRAQRDSLRVELADAKREAAMFAKSCTEAGAAIDALRAELDETKGKLAESDGALVGTMMALDTVRNALDEARRERDGARTKLGFWRDWVEQRLPTIEWHGDHSARAAIDAKLAAAKAGPVVTVDDAKAVAFAIGKVWESPYRETLISVRDRLAAFVQARGETEAGK
jgi:hypothetical protein